MHPRHSLTHLILGVVVALSLTPLMVAVDAQEQITFVSSRDGHIRDDVPGIPAFEIYVMDADGGISVDSPIIALMTVHLHGLRTANALSLYLIGMGTVKST